jgi:MYXO-CTERM domain-containing protein
VTLTKDATAWQGALDNGIVAHEFGHYVHLRQAACATTQCYAQSEGIADFVAGHMIIREGDDLLGTYATGVYSIGYLQDGAYFGVRRVPYSADLAKNALMFRHVQEGEPLPDTHPIRPNGVSNAEVHNAGEIWGTVLHDLYMALLGETLGATPRYTFAEARRLMSDYLVASLKLLPADHTFLEMRDALLAAAAANDPDDLALFAAAFARRGLGTCAEGPARTSETLTGVVESFELAPRLALVGARVDDRVQSCDHDGILDATEVGVLTVTLQNAGVAPVDGATMAVTALDAALSFPAGATATFGAIAPFATAEATVLIALDGSVTEARDVAVLIQAAHADACEGPVALESTFLVHRDEHPGTSMVDDVESPTPRWTVETVLGPAGLWARVEDETAAGNHLWHGQDHETFSDARLVSPPVTVSADGPFGLTFRHRHRFEYSNSTPWDGAVIEVSADGGATWDDVSEVGTPGYGGRITTQSGNPLAGRQAFVGESAAWPDLEPVIIDLGSTYLGQTVQVRFRIGTDQAQGGGGWELDDIAFIGLVAPPFATVGPDARACWTPVADAGPDQTVESGATVTLDGRGSVEPRGLPLAYQWSQLAGPPAPLERSDTATAGFVAPEVEDATPLRFRLRVASDGRSATDEVEITVAPRGTLGDGGPDPHLQGGDGCGCTAADGGAAGLLWILGTGWVVLRRRRR